MTGGELRAENRREQALLLLAHGYTPEQIQNMDRHQAGNLAAEIREAAGLPKPLAIRRLRHRFWKKCFRSRRLKQVQISAPDEKVIPITPVYQEPDREPIDKMAAMMLTHKQYS